MFPMKGEEQEQAGAPSLRGPVVRRPATAAEAKALAHPLRMRILRLCLDRSLTNKQLAEWLGKDPGTVLHLDHRGRLEPHRPTEGVRRDGDLLAYDLGATPPLPGS